MVIHMTQKFVKNYSVFLLMFLVIALVGLLPSEALAQADNFKGQAGRVSTQIGSIAKLIAFVSYVVGTVFAVKALFALKGFIQSPDDNPVNRFIAFGTVSALLMVLPYSIAVTQNSLDLQSVKNIKNTSGSFEAVATCAVNGLNQVFCNLAKELSPFSKMLAVFAYVMAASLVLTGLLNLKSFGDDPSQMPLRSIIMKFVLATMLISFPLAMNIFISTVTGEKASAKPVELKRPKLYK